jgi:hypothetical protein
MVDGSPTAGIGAGILAVLLAWFAWLLMGSRRRPFAIVLNDRVVSSHRNEKDALKAYAKEIEALALRNSGQTAGLPWAVVEEIGPGRRFAVIDQRAGDRRRRSRPGDTARRAIASAISLARGRRAIATDRHNRD